MLHAGKSLTYNKTTAIAEDNDKDKVAVAQGNQDINGTNDKASVVKGGTASGTGRGGSYNDADKQVGLLDICTPSSLSPPPSYTKRTLNLTLILAHIDP